MSEDDSSGLMRFSIMIVGAAILAYIGGSSSPIPFVAKHAIWTFVGVPLICLGIVIFEAIHGSLNSDNSPSR